MTIRIIRRGYTYVLYEITGDLTEITLQEMADRCDPNNFGFSPEVIVPGKVTMRVYID